MLDMRVRMEQSWHEWHWNRAGHLPKRVISQQMPRSLPERAGPEEIPGIDWDEFNGKRLHNYNRELVAEII